MNTPKIRGYIAEKENIIVLLYRRTTKVSYLLYFKYDRENEKLILGSRFYGKFYPNRCDLSADGKYFLYFAMGQSQKEYKEKLYCWTAICKPPLLKANILFKHNDTWGGGGRFIDNKTIFIDSGMYPEFDLSKEKRFDQYKITYNGRIEDNGWASGKNWKLMEYQINEKLGDKYSIPKFWIKTNGKITLKRTLAYNTFLKVKDGKTQGSYDMYSYVLIIHKSNAEIPLSTSQNNCLWADFDNYGRLVITYNSSMLIYKNDTKLLKKELLKEYNLEELISKAVVTN